jgi:cell division protein FtsW
VVLMKRRPRRNVRKRPTFRTRVRDALGVAASCARGPAASTRAGIARWFHRSPRPLRAKAGVDRGSRVLPTGSSAQASASGLQEPVAPKPPRGLDVVLFAAVLLLLALGTVMVYSASAVYAGSRYHDAMFFLKRHLIYAMLGLGALYVGWRIDYRLYRFLVYPALGLTIVLLAALLVPGIGTRVDGATRWFRVAGISFQPSELAKLTLILYLAHSLAEKGKQLRVFTVGFLPPLCIAGVIAVLMLKQPDLGSTAVVMAVTMLLLFVAGTRVSYLMLALLAAAPVVYQQIVGTPWRLRRIVAFLDPWAHRQDAGYQISESLISVGSGGLSGLGLGAGKQKLFFLPAAHTDFIFAITGEELGYVGLLVVVVLFGTLVVRGLRAALGANDLFGTYLAFGITALLGLQAAFHMSVVLGLVPTKGITLPFFSYGGSGLLINLLCAGILLNVAARHPLPSSVKTWRRRVGRRNRKRGQRVVVAGPSTVEG